MAGGPEAPRPSGAGDVPYIQGPEGGAGIVTGPAVPPNGSKPDGEFLLDPVTSAPDAGLAQPFSPIARPGPTQPKKSLKVLFVAGGGNAPGQNPFVKALGQRLQTDGHQLFKTAGGLAALVGDHPEFTVVSAQELAGIDENQGSMVWGTSRTSTATDRSLIEKMAVHLKDAEGAPLFDAVLFLGGDGTLTLARILHDKFGIPTLGVVKTMDGNAGLQLQEGEDPERVLSLGFSTSVDRAASYVERLQEKAKRDGRIYILEINGRNTGWLARATGHRTGVQTFVGEYAASLDDLKAAAARLQSSGGVIIVSESVTFTDGAHEVNLYDQLREPIRLSPFEILENLIIQRGITARNVDLTTLLAHDLHLATRELRAELINLALSAKSQGRINMVRVPAALLQAVPRDLPGGVLVVDDLDCPLASLAEAASERFASSSLALLVVPDTYKGNGMDDVMVLDPGMQHGHHRFQKRRIGATVAHYLAQEIPGLQGRTSHFTATHLLMAEKPSPSEKALAHDLAYAVYQAVTEGHTGIVVGALAESGRMVHAPFHVLRDMEVPRGLPTFLNAFAIADGLAVSLLPEKGKEGKPLVHFRVRVPDEGPRMMSSLRLPWITDVLATFARFRETMAAHGLADAAFERGVHISVPDEFAFWAEEVIEGLFDEFYRRGAEAYAVWNGPETSPVISAQVTREQYEQHLKPLVIFMRDFIATAQSYAAFMQQRADFLGEDAEKDRVDALYHVWSTIAQMVALHIHEIDSGTREDRTGDFSLLWLLEPSVLGVILEKSASGKNGVAVSYEVAPENFYLRMDRSRGRALDKAVQTLVENSRHYPNPALVEGESHVRIVARDQGDDLVIAVSDNGRGMAAEAVARYGEGRYRAPDVRDTAGSGLGTAIVLEQLEKLGAHGLHVQSKGGEGTLVSFALGSNSPHPPLDPRGGNRGSYSLVVPEELNHWTDQQIAAADEFARLVTELPDWAHRVWLFAGVSLFYDGEKTFVMVELPKTLDGGNVADFAMWLCHAGWLQRLAALHLLRGDERFEIVTHPATWLKLGGKSYRQGLATYRRQAAKLYHELKGRSFDNVENFDTYFAPLLKEWEVLYKIYQSLEVALNVFTPDDRHPLNKLSYAIHDLKAKWRNAKSYVGLMREAVVESDVAGFQQFLARLRESIFLPPQRLDALFRSLEQAHFSEAHDAYVHLEDNLGTELRDIDIQTADHRCALSRLLENLVINGIKHRNVVADTPGFVRMSARREGDFILFEVSDDGYGMSMEMMRDYGTGERGENALAAGTPGTGLGSKSVLEQLQILGGSLLPIQSSQHGEEHGTTISFKIPVEVFGLVGADPSVRPLDVGADQRVRPPTVDRAPATSPSLEGRGSGRRVRRQRVVDDASMSGADAPAGKPEPKALASLTVVGQQLVGADPSVRPLVAAQFIAPGDTLIASGIAYVNEGNTVRVEEALPHEEPRPALEVIEGGQAEADTDFTPSMRVNLLTRSPAARGSLHLVR